MDHDERACARRNVAYRTVVNLAFVDANEVAVNLRCHAVASLNVGAAYQKGRGWTRPFSRFPELLGQ
jgi:hypothetical protein